MPLLSNTHSRNTAGLSINEKSAVFKPKKKKYVPKEQKKILKKIKKNPEKYKIKRDSKGNIISIKVIDKTRTRWGGSRKEWEEVWSDYAKKEYKFKNNKLQKIINRKKYHKYDPEWDLYRGETRINKIKEFDYKNKKIKITDKGKSLQKRYEQKIDKKLADYRYKQRRRRQEKNERFFIENNKVRIRSEKGEVRNIQTPQEFRQAKDFLEERNKIIQTERKKTKEDYFKPGDFLKKNKKKAEIFNPVLFQINQKKGLKKDKNVLKVFRDEKGIKGYQDTVAKTSVFAGANKRYTEKSIHDLGRVRTHTKPNKKGFAKKRVSTVMDKADAYEIDKKISFNIDDYSGFIGATNKKISEFLTTTGEKYFDFVEKARTNSHITTSKGFIPKKNVLPSVAEKDVSSSRKLSGKIFDVGSYFVPYFGQARFNLFLASAGVSLLNPETYKAMKKDPINAGVQYSIATIGAGFKINKLLPKQRSYKKIIKELQKAGKGETKLNFKIIGNKRYYKVHKFNLNKHPIAQQYKTKLKIIEELKGKPTVGIGGNDKLKIVDVFGKNKVNRYVYLKKNPYAKLKIRSVGESGIIKTGFRYSYKGKTLKTGGFISGKTPNIKTISAKTDIFHNVNKKPFKKPLKIIESKLAQTKTGKIKASSNMYFRSTQSRLTGNVARLKKKLRQLKYVEKYTLDTKKITLKNPLVKKKNIKTFLVQGKMTPKKDVFGTVKLKFVNGKNKMLFSNIQRAPRTKVTLITKEYGATEYGNILRTYPNQNLIYGGVPVPSLTKMFSKKVHVPKLSEFKIKKPNFRHKLLNIQRGVGLTGSSLTKYPKISTKSINIANFLASMRNIKTNSRIKSKKINFEKVNKIKPISAITKKVNFQLKQSNQLKTKSKMSQKLKKTIKAKEKMSQFQKKPTMPSITSRNLNMPSVPNPKIKVPKLKISDSIKRGSGIKNKRIKGLYRNPIPHAFQKLQNIFKGVNL